ncbi:MAG: hypothetical protein ACK40C_09225 [Novosphingobium meiothermophilum]
MPPQQKYLFDVPPAGKIAEAARAIILAVKRDHVVTNAQIGALFDASADTVQRLEDMETKKVPASFITAIGAAFGEQYIQPYMALFGCRAVPQHCAEVINAVPAVTAFAAKLAAASINGGSRINHQALADIMPSLRDVDAIVSSLRAMASDLGIAA